MPTFVPPSSIHASGVAMVTLFVTVACSFDDEPIANSQGELAVAPSGSHNLRRCSNGRMQSRDAGLALPGVPQGECGTRGRQAVPLHLAKPNHQESAALPAGSGKVPVGATKCAGGAGIPPCGTVKKPGQARVRTRGERCCACCRSAPMHWGATRALDK